MKLDLNLGFIWGTYIGGTESDSGLGVAVDGVHNLYVVGETFSNDLGGTINGINALPSGHAVNLSGIIGNDDGYIAKLTPDGTGYLLVSYIGGTSGDLATGVALDPAGNIYIAGETISTDFPTNLTPGVIQGQCGSDGFCNAGASGALDDAFVVSIKANLSGYNYVTYYGGSGVDDAFAVAVDPNGNAFVTGTTASTDLLYTTNTFQTSLLGTQNAFLLELNSNGTAVNYDTYFGGDGSDFGLSVALAPSFDNSAYDVYLTGQSTSSSGSFPLLNATQAFGDGNSDAFVSVLSLSQGLLFSTFLGGGGDEDQFQGSIALDPSNFIYVSGDTDSGNGGSDAFPTVAALDTTYGGGTCVDNVGNSVPCTDAFIAEYGPANAADFGLSATPLSPWLRECRWLCDFHNHGLESQRLRRHRQSGLQRSGQRRSATDLLIHRTNTDRQHDTRIISDEPRRKSHLLRHVAACRWTVADRDALRRSGHSQEETLGFPAARLDHGCSVLPACLRRQQQQRRWWRLYRMHSCRQLHGHSNRHRFGEHELDPLGRSHANRQLKLTHYRNTFIRPMWGQPPSAVLGPKARSRSR